MSRMTSADFVTMPTGCEVRSSTSRIERVMLPLALDRLVGIGVGAERHDLRAVARIGKLALEQLGGIRLGVELGLEVEAGRVAEEAVGRARDSSRCSRARSRGRG